MFTELTSISEIIEKLGGIQAVADLTGRTYMATAQYSRFDKFPSRYHLVMTEALAQRGYSAPASLWGMIAAQDQPPTENAVAS